MTLKFLVVEGNTRETRERHKEAYGRMPGESYAHVLTTLAPDALCDIAFPADEGANLPDSAGLEIYDGVVLTGSALHLWDVQPEVARQVELARAVFHSCVPFFGSCWGLQVATVAAGGDVQKNPAGREVGFARNIIKTDAGMSHPLLTGRPIAFDAPCIHLDAVMAVPKGTTILASNAMTPVQAAEITMNGGTFWGVQYHPEFTLRHLGVIIERNAASLAESGFFYDAEDGIRFATDLKTLNDDRQRTDIAFKFGLGRDIVEDDLRLTEIRNFIELKVRPEKSRRGRA